MKSVAASIIGLTVLLGLVATAGGVADDPRETATVTSPTEPAADLPELGDLVPVVGRNGELIRCSDGQLLRVEVGSPPPAGIAESQPAPESVDEAIPGPVTETVDPAVPRCGPEGGGRDGEPVWIPASDATASAEAPEEYLP
jgi:hypothetical protein